VTSWRAAREFSLSRAALEALLANEIPAIRMSGFATAAECAGFAAAMRTGARKAYGVDRRIGYIGMAQYEYRWGRTKADYFAAVPEAYADQRDVFKRSFDPLRRFMDALGEHWPAAVEIARDPEGPYFAGIIRFASGGIGLHADFAPFNMPGYGVAACDAQLAWNLFVEAPTAGGVTTIRNVPWTPAMTDGEPPPSYGLGPEAADGETFAYAPAVGDVVIFNSRNPHEVSPGMPAEGPGRLQIGSFVGRMPDRRLVLFA
jgi:hypothetical protein